MKKLGAAAMAVMVSSLVMIGFSSPAANAVTFRTVSGTVKDSAGHPLAGVHVGIPANEAAFAVTAANGTYTIANVAQSSTPYEVDMLYPCGKNQVKLLIVNANKTLDFTVASGGDTDAFGYTCKPTTDTFVDLSSAFTDLTFADNDDGSTDLQLPFSFRYYGTDFAFVNVGTNGLLSFTTSPSSAGNVPIPDTGLPNAALYPFWDDLVMDPAVSGTVRVGTLGAAPNRRFIIEWRNARFFQDSGNAVSFEIVLSENRQIRFAYGLNTFSQRARGSSATVGIEDGSGSAGKGFQHSFNQVGIDTNFGILFTAPK